MEIYQKMYAIACAALSDALDALPWLPENLKVRLIIEKGLSDAEELFIEATADESEAL